MGFGKNNQGVILYDYSVIDASNLAALDCVLGSQGIVPTEDFRIIKMEAYIRAESDADQKCLVGIADGSLDAATVEEALEARPVDRNSTLLERTMRPVFPLGMVPTNSGNPVSTSIEKVLRWTFSDTDGWKFWAYNISEDACDADCKIFIFCKIYGVWVT